MPLLRKVEHASVRRHFSKRRQFKQASTDYCQSSDRSLLEQRLVGRKCRVTEGVPLTLTSRAGTTR